MHLAEHLSVSKTNITFCGTKHQTTNTISDFDIIMNESKSGKRRFPKETLQPIRRSQRLQKRQLREEPSLKEANVQHNNPKQQDRISLLTPRRTSGAGVSNHNLSYLPTANIEISLSITRPLHQIFVVAIKSGKLSRLSRILRLSHMLLMSLTRISAFIIG